MTKELKEEVELCKVEQNIRSQLQTLCDESKDSNNTMRDFISSVHLEEYCNKECNNVQNEVIANLKQQIGLLTTEKDSAFQLLQIKDIDASEQKLKIKQLEWKYVKYYEEQLEIVKQSHSEAIMALENKLLKVKDEFEKQHSLWMTSKKTIETLKQEKYKIENNLQDLKRNAQQKDKNNEDMIQSLTKELFVTKTEIKKFNDSNLHLEKQLCESKKIANNIMAKNEETKCKMAEALDLIEIAIKEKNVVLESKAKIMEQNAKLEAQLASIAEEHAIKMREEIAKLKNAHERDVKKYLLEIKELKSELREKVTLLEQSERSNRLLEMEMEKMRQYYDNLLEKSADNILGNLQLKSNVDQPVKHADPESDVCNMCKLQYSSDIQQLQEKITNLEENLAISNDKLKQIQQQNLILDEEKDMLKHYNCLENLLNKATNDKESLTTELKSLQSVFDNKVSKRDYKQCMLKEIIEKCEMNLEKCITKNEPGTSVSPVQVFSQHCTDTINKDTLNIRIEHMDPKWQSLLDEKLKEQQESFDETIKKMKNYIIKHDELNKRWIHEARTSFHLIQKFHGYYKATHRKVLKQNETIRTLEAKNDELQNLLDINKKLLLDIKKKMYTPDAVSKERLFGYVTSLETCR
ncbi:interaptin-like isoform X2 [Nylanderia fulva]|nr:interaptin-like isoform X2 [Nylanderia fulva]